MEPDPAIEPNFPGGMAGADHWLSPSQNNPAYASGHVALVLTLASLSPELDVVDLLTTQNEGCKYVLQLLCEARRIFQSSKAINQKMFDSMLKPLGGSAKSLTDPLDQMMEEYITNPHKYDRQVLLEKHQRDVMAFFDEKIRHYEQLMAGRKTQIDADAQARQKAALSPSPQTLYKILHYESTQEPQFFRAMDQLHILQSRRKANENN